MDIIDINLSLVKLYYILVRINRNIIYMNEKLLFVYTLPFFYLKLECIMLIAFNLDFKFHQKNVINKRIN